MAKPTQKKQPKPGKADKDEKGSGGCEKKRDEKAREARSEEPAEDEEEGSCDFDGYIDIDDQILDQDGALPDNPGELLLSDNVDVFLDGPRALPEFHPEGGLPVVRGHYPIERVKDSLQAYLREIGKFPMLKTEEELELSRRVKSTGDPEAALKLVSSHLRLVVRIAMDFQRRWMQNALDLIQEGNVGLVRAVSRFDPEKGIKFSYYATFWIKAYILKYIMDNWRLVKIGTTQTQRKLFYNLNKERQRLISMGFNPDASMLAKSLNVSEEQVIEMEQRLDSNDMSLDAPMGDDDFGGASRIDYMPALGPGVEETLANREMAGMVRNKLTSLREHLSDKELYILDNRLLADDPVTLREIGGHFSITRERVRQIEARLLQKVRDHLYKNIKNFDRDWIEH